MTTRALVTGGNGFVAQWAIRAMLEQGWQVIAAGIGPRPAEAILTAAEVARVRWIETDITDQAAVAASVRVGRADVILHLAGVSHIPQAVLDPGRTFEVNSLGIVRLLAEVRQFRDDTGIDPVVLVVGSAEQYGRHDVAEMPLLETSELRPLSLYAAAKASQEVSALQWHRSDALRVVCTRPFNHCGVGHGAHFLIPGLVNKALALRGGGTELLVGNTETIRDFLHVSDVVSAYLSLIERGIAGEVYNVSSGEGISVRQLAETVMDRVGVHGSIGIDPAIARAVDVPVLVGSNMKLREATGWAPRKTRHDIIDDLIHAATR